MRATIRGLLAILAMSGSADAADFYDGKTITLIVSSGTIGSYGDIAFALSRHMPRYIPGKPTIIVKGMTGAGNVLATNFLYNIAPKDGTTIGLINNAIPLHQVLDGRGAKYDVRNFQWLGSLGSFNSIVYAWKDSGITSIRQVMERPVTLGGTGVGSSIVMYPMAMNQLLGTRFNIITGDQLTTDIDLAMQRGEVQSRSGSYTSLKIDHPDWVRDGKIVPLVQIGSRRDAELAEVPLITELATSPQDRDVMALISTPIAMGRPLLAPPGVPGDRVDSLRKALDATFQDAEFLAEMKKLNIDVAPDSGQALASIIDSTVSAPPAIIERAKFAIGELGTQAPPAKSSPEP